MADIAGAASFEVFAARVSWTYPDLAVDELDRLRAWYDVNPAQAASGGAAMRWAYIYWEKPIS
ncbi:hypothetical protein ACMHYJ_13425 [Castellaniella hirudinis]|uniref:hypothetical protein n=1 Tax=Castellaniella hirudinis TaxID=1144617 RepID=UPI0039C228AE